MSLSLCFKIVVSLSLVAILWVFCSVRFESLPRAFYLDSVQLCSLLSWNAVLSELFLQFCLCFLVFLSLLLSIEWQQLLLLLIYLAEDLLSLLIQDPKGQCLWCRFSSSPFLIASYTSLFLFDKPFVPIQSEFCIPLPLYTDFCP